MIIHFTDEETGKESVSSLPRATQPVISELGSKPRLADPSLRLQALPSPGGNPRGFTSLFNSLGYGEGEPGGGLDRRRGSGWGLPQERDHRRGNRDVFTVKNELTLLSPSPRDAKQLGAWPGPRPPPPQSPVPPARAPSIPALSASKPTQGPTQLASPALLFSLIPLVGRTSTLTVLQS